MDDPDIIARLPHVGVFATNAESSSVLTSVYDQLFSRDVLDWSVQLVPFLVPEDSNQFRDLLDKQPPSQPSKDIPRKPEAGDTAKTLYQKLRGIRDDDEAVDFRAKLDRVVKQAVQERIEVEQANTAALLGQLNYVDEDEATQAYELFGKQFPKAVETGKFMSTPTKESDIKYRWRRLKDTLQIDSKAALELIQKDASPLFVDPDFIRRAFKAMREGCDRGGEEALEDIVMKNPASLIADPKTIKVNLGQAKVFAAFQDATRSFTGFFREAIFDNGRRVPIGRRDEPAFGGGFPAWKRKWEEESQAKQAQDKS